MVLELAVSEVRLIAALTLVAFRLVLVRLLSTLTLALALV